jgi:hypothetical protein
MSEAHDQWEIKLAARAPAGTGLNLNVASTLTNNAVNGGESKTNALTDRFERPNVRRRVMKRFRSLASPNAFAGIR